MKKFSVVLTVLALGVMCACGSKKEVPASEASISDTSITVSASVEEFAEESFEESADLSPEVSENASTEDTVVVLPKAHVDADADIYEYLYDIELSAAPLQKEADDFGDNYKEPTVPIEKRLTRKPDREELPEGIAAVLYDDAPFYVTRYVKLADYGTIAKYDIKREFHISDYNYLYVWNDKPHGDVYWRKYLVTDLNGDGVNELFFELSGAPFASVDSDYNTVFFEQAGNKVVLHVLNYDFHWKTKKLDFLRLNLDWVVAERPFEERLLVAPKREEAQPEIAAVLYDEEPFTVLQKEYITDDDYIFYSGKFTMPEYDWHWYYADNEEQIATGGYEPVEIYWIGYTIIDLDGNGTEELVYYIEPGEVVPSGYFLIFAVVDGEVCAYTMADYEIGVLRTDGTMETRGGADTGSEYRITNFRKDGYDTDVLTSYHMEKHYIGDKEVSWEEMDEFSKKNISTMGPLWTAVDEYDSWLNYYSRGEHFRR